MKDKILLVTVLLPFIACSQDNITNTNGTVVNRSPNTTVTNIYQRPPEAHLTDDGKKTILRILEELKTENHITSDTIQCDFGNDNNRKYHIEIIDFLKAHGYILLGTEMIPLIQNHDTLQNISTTPDKKYLKMQINIPRQ